MKNENMDTESEMLNAAIDEIVNRLFINGSGEKAHRLVLELENGHNGGGWCKDAVRDQIRDVLQKGKTNENG